MNKIIHIISGDSFYRKKERNNILSSLNCNYIEKTLNSPDEKVLISECMSNSLFGNFKVIKIEDFIYKDEMNVFFKKLCSLGNFNFFIIIEYLDSDDASNLFHKLSDVGLLDFIELYSLGNNIKPKKRISMIQEFALEKGLKVDSLTSELLLDLCVNDMQMSYEEINKLSLVCKDSIYKKDVLNYVLAHENDYDSIQFYISLMNGDPVNSIFISKRISNDLGHEIILGCLVRLSYLSLIISKFNGNEDSAINFLKKKRFSVSCYHSLNFLSGVKIQNDVPSKFIMKVSKKLYDRVSGRNIWLRLFGKCYDNYVNYRMTQNNNVASAEIEKIICLISRS